MRFRLIQPLALERSARGHIPRPGIIETIQLLRVCLIKCRVDSIPSTICSHGGVQRWLIKRTLVDPTLYCITEMRSVTLMPQWGHLGMKLRHVTKEKISPYGVSSSETNSAHSSYERCCLYDVITSISVNEGFITKKTENWCW